MGGALARVENRFNYGFITDVFDLGASYAEAISQAYCFNHGKKAHGLSDEGDGVGSERRPDGLGYGGDRAKMVLLAQSKLDDAGFADWLRQQAKQSAESSGE